MVVVANRRSIMTLFSSPNCAECHRVRIILAEKDISVDVVDIDPFNKPEDLLDLNPYNNVPTLVDRDLVLYESRIIMEYLDERFPHPPLMPVDPVSRARSRLALYRVEKDWYTLVNEFENGDSVRVERARKLLTEMLIASSEIFSVKPFFLSDEFSLVDATIIPILWRLPHYGIHLPESCEDIHSYMKTMFERESFQQSLSPAERMMRDSY